MAERKEAIVLPVEGEPRIVTLSDDRELMQLQSEVGGNIEYVQAEPDWGIFLNEEGKLQDLPLNPLATQLVLHRLSPGDYIAGTVVMVGSPDAAGETRTVPRKCHLIVGLEVD